MLTPDVLDRRAWSRRALGPADWVVPLPDAAVAELQDVASRLRRDPLPLLLLSPAHFVMPACAAVMATAARMLRDGVGLVVIDRLPVDAWSPDECRSLYWLLGSTLGRPVAQKWDGTMLYDVRDTGKPLEYGVRRSVTNRELLFHTDAPWLDRPPELVGLLCLQAAQAGGASRFLSLVTVHDRLRRRHPELLSRLSRPFPWDRQAEHAPGDATVAWQPVFEENQHGLIGRCNEALIQTGADLAGVALDPEGTEALAVMRATLDDPELWVELTIERGQIQYLNNRHFAHSRTAFRDAEEPSRKRHLLRLWNRDEGRPTFHG